MQVYISFTDVEKFGYYVYNPLQTQNLDISNIVDDGECTEIVCDDVLDYVGRNNCNSLIDNWISKLAYNGRLVIGGTDLYEVCQAFFLQRLTAEETNTLLFGKQQQQWDTKSVAFTLRDMSALLKAKGLKIVNARTNNFHYTVIAQKLK